MVQDDGRDDEVNALLKNENLDSAKIAEQIAQKSGEGKKETPAGEQKPGEQKPGEQKPGEQKPADIKDVPNPETIRATMLNEMFGEQFKTVEDVKNANIPEALKELVTLRQKNQELETQNKARPKHHYANDDIAKMDEFVRATGIKDVSVFNKINAVPDVATMDDMEALILQHIIENPRLAGKDPQTVRKYFETKYNVDPAKVDSGDLTKDELEYNKMELEAQADKAKVKLQELKGKIKMPEIPKEEIPGGKNKWTPEIETAQKTSWGKVNESMYKEFSKLPIHLKGGKEPIVNFELPEEAKSKVLSNALDYIVSNQLEVNEANVTATAKAMFRDIRDSYFDDILHAVFERARTMTEKEYLEKYSSPSSKKNTDTPPGGGGEESDEAKREKAYKGELERK